MLHQRETQLGNVVNQFEAKENRLFLDSHAYSESRGETAKIQRPHV